MLNFQTSAMKTAKSQLIAIKKPAAERLFCQPTASGIDLSIITKNVGIVTTLVHEA
jgi:hypothetical protein